MAAATQQTKVRQQILKEFRAANRKKTRKAVAADRAKVGKISSIINKFKKIQQNKLIKTKQNPESIKANGEKF